MKTKNIQIADIRIDGGTQQRDEINPGVVGDYAEAMRCGAKFPAITVFFDGAQYWLADGYHRYHASKEIEALSIMADVEDGMVEDAILFSVGANKHHGLNRTNAEKKKSVFVLLKHPKWSQWTAREIARHCGVSNNFVSDLIKKEAEAKNPTAKNVEQPQKPISKDKSPESTIVSSDDSPALEPSTGLIPENQEDAESLTVDESYPQADDNEHLENLIAQSEEMMAELADLHTIIAADDKLSAACAELKKEKAISKILNERMNGLMNEKNALIQTVKSRDRTIKKLEDQLKKIEAEKF